MAPLGLDEVLMTSLDLDESEASNDLERILLNAMKGRISVREFLGAFLNAPVYVAAHSPISQDAVEWDLMIFDKMPERLIACFTGLEKAARYAVDWPYQLSMTGKEFLERIPKTYGVVINPGSRIGLELASYGISKLLNEAC